MGCAGGLGDPGSRVSLRDGSPVVVRGLVGAFHYLSIYLFIAICRPPPGARRATVHARVSSEVGSPATPVEPREEVKIRFSVQVFTTRHDTTLAHC